VSACTWGIDSTVRARYFEFGRRALASSPARA